MPASGDRCGRDEGSGSLLANFVAHPARLLPCAGQFPIRRAGGAVDCRPAPHFPMQNLEKITPSRSSAVNSPVIDASATCASRNASA